MPTTLNYTATYNPTVDIGKVRRAIQDIDVDTTPPADPDTTPRNQWSCLFVDEEIQITIDKYSGAVTNYLDMAAAELLEEIASSNALIAKMIVLGDYTSDTRQTAKILRDQADALRMRASKAASIGSEEPAEAIHDEGWDDFTIRREYLVPGDIPG